MAKIFGVLLLVLALTYVAIVAYMVVNQRRFIYPAPQGFRETPPGFERVAYATSDGLQLTGGFLAPREDRPVLLFFHGNAADWQSAYGATDRLAALGYGVFAAAYRGYRNPGTPSEQGLYRDGRAAFAWLRSQGYSDDRIVLVGNSLGSGVATQLATEIEPHAVILISPLASMSRTVAGHYAWLPTDYILQDRYENLDKIGRISAPVAVIHGESDTLIQIGEARLLTEAAPDGRLYEIPDQGHNLVYEAEAQDAQIAFLGGLGA